MSKKILYGLLIAPTVIVVMVALITMNWRVPTLLRINLIVDRVVFTVSGNSFSPILNSIGFNSITIEKFEDLKFNPESLALIDQNDYSIEKDQFLESSSILLPFSGSVIITSENEALHPAATIENKTTGAKTVGIMDKVWTDSGADVSLEIKGERSTNLTIKVDNKRTVVAIILYEPVRLIATYCEVSGTKETLTKGDLLIFDVHLPNHSPELEITGREFSFVSMLTISPQDTKNLFHKGQIPVSMLDFTRQDATGNRVTTLIKEGTITYPEFPKIKEVSFKASDTIKIGDLEKFIIEDISIHSEPKGIKLSLYGFSDYLTTGPHEYPQDRRLTRINMLWQNQQSMVLFSIIIWMLSTTAGAYRWYRELKGGKSLE